MGTVVVFYDPTNLKSYQGYAHSGPYIDFLLEHFPNGFVGGHFSSINLDRLPVEDYDRVVGDDDLVTLSLFPGNPGVYAIAAAVAAIAAMVYAVMMMNSISMPKPLAPAYTSGSLPTADSVYTFSGQANTARIGQTIPVAYGRNLIAPDQAMAPYSYFEGNNQYLIQLMCLGQGTYIVHGVKVAGSNAGSLGEDVVSYYVYPAMSNEEPSHWRTFGNIQTATGRFENVYTSPSVADQELYAPQGGAFHTTAWIGRWTYRGDVHEWFDLSIPAQEYAQAIQSGRPVWMVVHDGPNAGTWAVSFLFHSGSNLKEESLRYIRGYVWPAWTDGTPQSASITLTYIPPWVTEAEEGGGLIGPFRATPVGVTTNFLQYDLVFPSGCFSASSTGGLSYWTVSVTFIAEPIDDAGNVIGDAIAYPFLETMATNTPQRRTVHHGPVPDAQYRVSARRTTNLSDRASDQSICHWTGLKSILGNTAGGPVYGDVTLISVKIKATEGLASNAHQSLLVDCSRTKDGGALDTPTKAFKDILTNQVYGARRPLSELDTDTLSTLAASWSGQKFRAVFDNQTTIWDALKLSVQMQSAIPITTGSVVSIVADEAVVNSNSVLTDAQIKSAIMSYRFSELADYDGVEGEYKNPADNAAEYVIEPFDSVNPDKIVLWGCKDSVTATTFVKRYWKQMKYRRRTLSLELEGDGHSIQLGDAVDVTYTPLELDALCCIVQSIKVSDEFSTTVELTVYQPEVFSNG